MIGTNPVTRYADLKATNKFYSYFIIFIFASRIERIQEREKQLLRKEQEEQDKIEQYV
jgi:hypothetical protein